MVTARNSWLSGGKWAANLGAAKKAGASALVVSCPEAMAASGAQAAQCREVAAGSAAGGVVTVQCIYDAVTRKALGPFGAYLLEAKRRH